MKKLPLALGAGVFSLALVLTGCSDASAPTGENTAPSDTSSTVTANDADEMFVTMMIPHHQQAIEMADQILAKDGIDERIVSLAEQIKAAQDPEIQTMKGWLQEWGVPYDDSMSGMEGMDMGGGMMSEDDMAALDAATGVEATRLFLNGMIAHHQGALTMVEELMKKPGAAQESEMFGFVSDVVADQTAEIERMGAMLQEYSK